MQARDWLALASTISLTIANSRGDQPRMSVWPSSTTKLRPLRNSLIFWSKPVAMIPMSVLAMKMPDSVTNKATMRSNHPLSLAIVPGSMTRSRLCQKASRAPTCFSSLTAARKTIRTIAAARMIAAVIAASHRMTTLVPRENALSTR